MASDLNKVILIGRLTKDPELRYTQGGSAVASFSIANNKNWKDKEGNQQEKVSFFNCTAWAKGGEIIAQYMTKGKQIQITGRLEQKVWDDKEGKKQYSVEVVVEDFQFLGGKNDSGSQSETVTPISNEPDPFSSDTFPM
jgi:single-strand DNA-binding protein